MLQRNANEAAQPFCHDLPITCHGGITTRSLTTNVGMAALGERWFGIYATFERANISDRRGAKRFVYDAAVCSA